MIQIHAINAKSEVIAVRPLRRGAALAFFEKLPACEVVMETCSSAHHWGRALQAQGQPNKV